MEKTFSVNVNGNKYVFKCRSFVQEGEYPIVNQCELYLGTKLLSKGEVNFTKPHPSFEEYEFDTVLHSAVRNCNNSEYYKQEKEFLSNKNRDKMTPKLKEEFLEIFHNIPLIKDMDYLWNKGLETPICE